MKATIQATVNSIHRKISARENTYHEITITETILVDKDTGECQDRVWNKLYFQKELEPELAKKMINKQVDAELSFYPVQRRSGDNVYSNIKCHLESINLIKDIG